MRALIDYVVSDGWTIDSFALSHQHGDDVVASRGAQHLVIEAKGDGSSKNTSSRFVAGRSAQAAVSPAAKAAAWAAGQAAGVAHMGAHALGAAAYAAKAAELVAPGRGGAAEIAWQAENMSEAVKAALRQLPLLGEDSAGPLGSGLLASGVLGENIRVLQSSLNGAA